MDIAKSDLARVESILVLEQDVVIAQDLAECLREVDGTLRIVATRDKDAALAALKGGETFQLAIVPHTAREEGEFFETLLEKVPHVTLHGKTGASDPADDAMQYLASPFSSETVAALYRRLTSS